MIGPRIALWVGLWAALFPFAPLSHFGLADAASAKEIDSTFSFREILLPPGVPSVALRTDETAILWNPAGLAMSKAYYVGYSWKGTYLKDDKQAGSHFLLTKARGFGIGFVRDDYSEHVKTTTIFTLSPHVIDSFSLGFTGKWKGGFNFDCGAMLRAGDRVTFGFVGRNLREKKDVRRYLEGGVAITAVPHKLNFFFDVINEESPWRDALAYGGGFTAKLEYSIYIGASYFYDGDGNKIFRTSLSFLSGVNILAGEYSISTDNWRTIGGRFASSSQ
jgi:opacity protein-like surface antigen